MGQRLPASRERVCVPHKLTDKRVLPLQQVSGKMFAWDEIRKVLFRAPNIQFGPGQCSQSLFLRIEMLSIWI